MMTRVFAAAAVLACFITFPGPATGQQATWKAGLASIRITPAEPVVMAGYANRNKPSQGVSSDLYVKALAIEDPAGHRGVIVTSDLIGFRGENSVNIARLAAEKLGLKREQILLNSSHTHAGPTMVVWDSDRKLMPEAAAATERYLKELEQRIVTLMGEAISKLEPAKLSWGLGTVNFVMNRREFTPGGVILGNNPRGYVDRSVPVLRIDSVGGELRGVLFGAACHNTTMGGDNYLIDAEYAGWAQQHVEAAKPGVVAMFMLGCGGDANPFPRGKLEDAKAHGRELGGEVLRVIDGQLTPRQPGKLAAIQPGALKTLLAEADLPLAPAPSMEEIKAMLKRGGWQQFVAAAMLARIEKGETLPTQYRAPIAVWQFGNDLTLVGISGETTSEYVGLVEKAIGPLQLWVAGYCNDVFGYLPSTTILREGGYETRGLIHGSIGIFAPQAQDVVIDTVRRLAAEAGRRP